MKIDREEARRIAGLAHLEFDDAGLDAVAADMTSILSYIEQLREASADEFEESDGTVLAMREDEPRPSLERSAVEANAPAWRDGFFVVPKVIE